MIFFILLHKNATVSCLYCIFFQQASGHFLEICIIDIIQIVGIKHRQLKLFPCGLAMQLWQSWE